MSSNSTYVTVPSTFTLTGVTQDASNNVVFPAGIQMPNAAASTSSFGVVFGPATSAGTKLVRNTSSTLQSILADGSANARVAGNLFNSTNDQGLGSPNFVLNGLGTYGLYMTATGPYVGFGAAGNWGCRTSSTGATNIKLPMTGKSSTGNTIAAVETGGIFFNTGGTQTQCILPASSSSAGSLFIFLNSATITTGMKISATGNDVFWFNGTTGTIAGSMTSASIGATICLTYNTLGYWMPVFYTGSWTLI